MRSKSANLPKLTHLIVATLAVALGTSACTPTPTASEAKPEPSASASVSPAPTVSPIPTQAPVTCQTLVTPDALRKLTSGGSEFTADFEDRVRNSPNDDLARFLRYGGVACQWGYPNSDAVTVLSYSPLTAGQAATERKRLSGQGWTAEVQPDGSEMWATADVESNMGYRPVYVFTTGSWRYALDISALADFAL